MRWALLAGLACTFLLTTASAELVWQALQPDDCTSSAKPQCRYGASVVAWEREKGSKRAQIYVFGGLQDDLNGGSTYNDLWLLDAAQRPPAWSLLLPNDCSAPPSVAPDCRVGHTATLVGDAMYVFGGRASAFAGPLLGILWRYDLQTSRWSQPSTGPDPRGVYNHATATDGEFSLYVFGGMNGVGSATHRLVEYDILEARWYIRWPLKDMTLSTTPSCPLDGSTPACLRDHTMVYHNNALFAFGGLENHASGAFRATNALYKFDLTLNLWAELIPRDCASSTLPACRSGHSMVLRESKLFVFGGLVGSASGNDIWEGDPSTRAWTRRSEVFCTSSSSVPECRTAHAMHSFGDVTIAFGGRSATRGAVKQLNGVWLLRDAPEVFPDGPQSAPLPLVPTEGGVHLPVPVRYVSEGESFRVFLVPENGRFQVPCASAVLSSGGQQISCEIPPGFGANMSVTVTAVSLADWHTPRALFFSYEPPRITSLYVDASAPGLRPEAVLREFVNELPTLPIAGGVWLNITGFNFGPALALTETAVFIGSTPCAQVSWRSHERLDCLVPPGTGKDWTCTVRIGNQLSTPAEQKVSYTPPSIRSLNVPTSPSTSGGAVLTIEGNNLGLPNILPRVTIGTQLCPVLKSSPQSVECQVPPGTGSENQVRVLLSGQSAIASVTFAYAPPQILGVHRGSSTYSTNGGGILIVEGHNFGNVDWPAERIIRIASTPCTSTVQTSPSTLQCVVPPGVGANLSVTAEVDGLSSETIPGAFSYAPPTIESLSWSSAPPLGGSRLTVAGREWGPSSASATAFSSAVEVRVLLAFPEYAVEEDEGATTSVLSRRQTECGDVVRLDDFRLTCRVPEGVGGEVEVRVRVGGVSMSEPARERFRYDPPQLEAVEYATDLSTEGGTLLTLHGRNFGPDPAVYLPPPLTSAKSENSSSSPFDEYRALGPAPVVLIRSQPCLTTTWLSDRRLECVTPPGAGIASATVVVGGQPSQPISITYAYPSIERLLYTRSPTTGGVPLTIEGTNLKEASNTTYVTVTVGGRICKNVEGTSRRLTCAMPPGTGRKIEVRVNVGGLISQPALLYYEPPTLNVVDCAPAPTAGGSMCRLYGSNLGSQLDSPRIWFQFALSPSTVWTASYVEALVPAGVGARLTCTVEIGGQFAAMHSVFSYLPPQVLSVTAPRRLNTTGGDSVLVRARNFGRASDRASVRIGGTACLRTEWLSEEELLCRAPEGAGGNASISVAVANHASPAFYGLAYYEPVVVGVTYNLTEVTTNGGGRIAVHGRHFGARWNSRSVFVEDLPCTPVEWYSDQLIHCVAPPGRGSRHLRIVVEGQENDLARDRKARDALPREQRPIYETLLYPGPIITAIRPSVLATSVPGRPAQTMTIIGRNFGHLADGVNVTLGSRMCKSVAIHKVFTEMTCVPDAPGEPSVLPVVVTVVGASSDPFPYRFVIPSATPSLVAVVRTVTIGVMGCCGLLLMAVYVHRNSKHIKAASPAFCGIIVLGAIAQLLSILFLSDGETPGCYGTVWLVAFGTTMMFGSLVLKNWRLLRIFDVDNLAVVVLSNCTLYIAQLAMLLVDTAALVTYTYYSKCGWPEHIAAQVASVILAGWKACLLIAGVVVAIRSRVIHLPEFSERVQLGQAIYNAAFACLLVVPLMFLFRGQTDATYLLVAVALLLVNIGTLGVLFTPKLAAILRDHYAGERWGSRRNSGRERSGRNTPSHNSSFNNNAAGGSWRPSVRRPVLATPSLPDPLPSPPLPPDSARSEREQQRGWEVDSDREEEAQKQPERKRPPPPARRRPQLEAEAEEGEDEKAEGQPEEGEEEDDGPMRPNSPSPMSPLPPPAQQQQARSRSLRGVSVVSTASSTNSQPGAPPRGRVRPPLPPSFLLTLQEDAAASGGTSFDPASSSGGSSSSVLAASATTPSSIATTAPLGSSSRPSSSSLVFAGGTSSGQHSRTSSRVLYLPVSLSFSGVELTPQHSRGPSVSFSQLSQASAHLAAVELDERNEVEEEDEDVGLDI